MSLRLTMCKRGLHPLTPENTDVYGSRRCAECRRVADKARYRKKRDMRLAGVVLRIKQQSKKALVEPCMSPAEVDARLCRAVALETAPPWVRHPVQADPRDFLARRDGASSW